MLTQPGGVRTREGHWRNPEAAVLDITTVCDGDITVRALYAALEDPHRLRATQEMRLARGHSGEVQLDWHPTETGRLTEFFLAIATEAPGGACLQLDAIRLTGAVFDADVRPLGPNG